MAYVGLCDKNMQWVEFKPVGTDDLPPIVSMVVQKDYMPGRGQRVTYVSSATVLKLLEDLPAAKLEDIIMWSFRSVSPEYLACLTLSVSKTKGLVLHRMSRPEELEHIATGLSQPNELKELYLDMRSMQAGLVSNENIRMVLRALSCSSSLEELHLIAPNSLNEDTFGNELISAIRGMRELETLELDAPWTAENNGVIQSILHAVVQHAPVKDFCLKSIGGGNPDLNGDFRFETFDNPRRVLEKFSLKVGWTEDNRLSLQRIVCLAIANIKELAVCNTNMGPPLLIDHEAWSNALCRPNCRLEKLHLHGVKLDNDDANSDGASKNTSVKDLYITRAVLKCSGTRALLNRFQSLESLNLGWNNSIRTISLFNNMLSGDESTLKRLVLFIVNVEEDDLKSFLSRIPHMRSLRALELHIRNQNVDSNPCVDLLEKAVLRNTSLQQVIFTTPPANWEECRLDKSLGVALSLNRAGRGFLRKNGSMIKSSLWPLVLERAGKISYYSVRDEWESPSVTDTRVDAVYWLLREEFFHQVHDNDATKKRKRDPGM